MYKQFKTNLNDFRTFQEIAVHIWIQYILKLNIFFY